MTCASLLPPLQICAKPCIDFSREFDRFRHFPQAVRSPDCRIEPAPKTAQALPQLTYYCADACQLNLRRVDPAGIGFHGNL
jgi:hypothetical protein